MFSLQIVDSDAFLDMPQSTQLLYFHLSMRADDEGFVGNPKKIMRMIGTSEDDMKVLLAKRFLLSFQSGVVVIKHWLIHNTIRMDRFNPTTYEKEKKLLTTKENKAYTEVATNRQPDGNLLVTQVKLSKVNLSKVKKASSSKAEELAKPFNLQEEIKKLEESPRRELNIIAFLIEKRQVKLESSGQLRATIKRHIRAANQLKEFNNDQLLIAYNKVCLEYPQWTLETLIKMLTK